MTCHTSEGAITVAANLKVVLADGAALKGIWSSKGASGMKPCLLCANVLMARRADLEDDDFITIECVDTKWFVLHRNRSIGDSADKLVSLNA